MLRLCQGSRVGQWKRAGTITQRSMDRNHTLLNICIGDSCIELCHGFINSYVLHLNYILKNIHFIIITSTIGITYYIIKM